MSRARFTVCVLLYGNYPELARRVLSSVLQERWRPHFAELRLGCNAISDETVAVVQELLEGSGLYSRLYSSAANIYKYPMMRLMFTEPPLETPYTMWFDDDSYILPTAPDSWPLDVYNHMQQYDMIGSPWLWKLSVMERARLAQRPWHTQRPMDPTIRFLTGGWWTIRTGILRKHDWPPPDMQHNGGDVTLAHLFHQQRYAQGKFTAHLGINTDHTNKDSAARRRGVSQYPYFHEKAGQERK